MATLARLTTPEPVGSVCQYLPQPYAGAVAAAAIAAGDACYLSSTGINKSDSTGTGAANAFIGLAAAAAASGEAVTVFGRGARFRYGSGLTVGAKYYIDTTAGRLADAATTNGTTVVAQAVSTTDIVVVGWY